MMIIVKKALLSKLVGGIEQNSRQGYIIVYSMWTTFPVLKKTEDMGFEPTVRLLVHSLSKEAPSATRSILHFVA